MAKTPYTVDVEEYVCTELERIRRMTKTLDFSGLPAIVERIQIHADRMEEAIRSSFSRKWRIKDLCSNDTLSDKEFRKQVKEAMKKEK